MVSKKGRDSTKESQHNENLLAFLKVENMHVESKSYPVEEELIVSFVEEKGGKVTKSELYEWAKVRGLTPATLYRIIARLIGEKVLRKEFDEDVKELVYILISR
ncbi:MAG: hypothetical protein QW291_06060 [Thermofilaceae archaeon]